MRKKVAKILAVFCLFISAIIIGNFANAEGEPGKINISKTATKTYENAKADNLEYGRLAQVKLTVNANSYTEQTVVNGKLDIVIVFDGSKSMASALDGKSATSKKPSRLSLAKEAAIDFANTLMDNSANVQIGIVEYESDVKDVQELTNNKKTVIDFINNKLNATGGTNLQSGIAKAKDLLNKKARKDAKQIIILLSDGEPTYFNYNGKRYGEGDSDAEVCVEGFYRCTKSMKPSDAAKTELDGIKKSYANADIYTIMFSKVKGAKELLNKINPEHVAPLYKNYEALTGEELKTQFQKIAENAYETIGYNATVTDIIPNNFELTSESVKALQSAGNQIIENNDGTTSIIWKIGTIKANNEQELTYIIKAKDEYHGSMYTNAQATLTATVAENNPYYKETSIISNFQKPVVEIPAITNDDHYNNNSSYITYGTSQINGSSILSNDYNKNIIKENGKTVTDTLVIEENENVKKTRTNTYNILKNNRIQGVLTVNNDGTFKFMPNDNVTGEIQFTYHIDSKISPVGETTIVHSNSSTVTLKVNERAKINISGKKTWIDSNNQDGIRPEEITVRLLADGVEIANKTVTEKDNWAYTFENLPKYNDGKQIVYTISEDAVEPYETEINGYNIINSYKPETTFVSGIKTWNDANNQDGIRPEEITVRLLADGVEIANKTVTKKDNWAYTFENLPKYNDGKQIVYTISEDKVTEYETQINNYNITNTHNPETINIIGEKIWIDNNNQDGIRPEKITIELYANGEKTQTLDVNESSSGKWGYAFLELPKYQNGNEISYEIKEIKVAGYETEIIDNEKIVNTHLVSKIDISGEKTWIDSNNQDGIRPEEINIKLFADGVEIDTKKVTASDNWTYTFEDLEEYKNGKKISYTINEEAVKGYSTEIENYNITNTHVPEKINISGEKTWNDSNNQDGIRPENITLNLLKNGEKISSLEVSEKTEWKYIFESLDKYTDGKENIYTIEEVAVTGYTTEIKDFNLTNTHEVEKITFKSTKIWDDYDNQDGIRVDSVKVKLYKNQELLREITISAESNWSYAFENLDRYENGKEILYTIEEDSVIGYESTIEISEIDENNIIHAIIKNTHTPEKINIEGTKTWDDNNNKLELRPDKINITLYANGKKKDVITISETDNWEYVIENLDKYENGEEILYTIEEEKIEFYTPTYNGFNITNKIEDFGIGEGIIEELPPQTGMSNNIVLYNSLIETSISPKNPIEKILKNSLIIANIKITIIGISLLVNRKYKQKTSCNNIDLKCNN